MDKKAIEDYTLDDFRRFRKEQMIHGWCFVIVAMIAMGMMLYVDITSGGSSSAKTIFRNGVVITGFSLYLVDVLPGISLYRKVLKLHQDWRKVKYRDVEGRGYYHTPRFLLAGIALIVLFPIFATYQQNAPKPQPEISEELKDIYFTDLPSSSRYTPPPLVPSSSSDASSESSQ